MAHLQQVQLFNTNMEMSLLVVIGAQLSSRLSDVYSENL